MLEIGDLYSPWIIEQAGSKDDGKFLTKILDMSLFQTGQLGMIMLIVGGLIALLSNITQVFLMFVRSGLLTLLTGFSPLAAGGPADLRERRGLRDLGFSREEAAWLMGGLQRSDASRFLSYRLHDERTDDYSLYLNGWVGGFYAHLGTRSCEVCCLGECVRLALLVKGIVLCYTTL